MAGETVPGINESSTQESQIEKFYNGCNVFITGGTGFLGKILIEKLLRSTEVSTIYMLVRPKKGKNMLTRVDELFDDVIFQSLKQETPKFKHRVVPVGGDCLLAGLGLNITDTQVLISNVNVVFHVAATVRFDEQLKLAYTLNVSAARDVLNLCKQIKNIKSIIHVSTAYSNCHLDKIEEMFYKYPVKYQDIETLLDKLDDRDVNDIMPQILGKWPNTYAFTKALAESMVYENCVGLPLGVFRPAIVVSTYQEPVEGWIDNLYGPTGVCAGAISGVLRTLVCGRNVNANIVPVDTCVSALIASAWDVATKKCERIAQNVPVYNYVSSAENSITWGEYNKLAEFYCGEYPVSNAMWYISFRTTSNTTLYAVQKIILHFAPAICLDAIAIVLGKKPRLLQMYKKVHKFSDVISYFCIRNWTFTNDNVTNLWNKMNDRDKTLFPMSISCVKWLEFFRTYILGIRQYILKEPVDTLEVSRKKQKRLFMLHVTMKYTLAFLSMQFLWSVLYRIISLVL